MVAAIYSHLSHNGKCIYVQWVPVSFFCLSIFSYKHSQKQSPSITTSVRLYLSLLYCKPFLSISPSLAVHTHVRTHTSISLSLSASHLSPGEFFGDQSSSSQRCHNIASHTHTNIYHNEWTTNANFYIINKIKMAHSHSQVKNTHAWMQTQPVLIPSLSEIDVCSQPFAVAFWHPSYPLAAGKDAHSCNEPAL